MIRVPAAGMAILALAASAGVSAAEPATGPVIDGFGPVYPVPDASMGAPEAGVLRGLFDVAEAPGDPATPNPRIASVARYLNMHARAGLSADRMAAALVLHGEASRAVLDDEAYWERFDTVNPDRKLLEALAASGVPIYLCGQTAGFRGYAPEDLADPVQVALSAMTAVVRLQDEGYRLIP